jgi:hypothetical protein
LIFSNRPAIAPGIRTRLRLVGLVEINSTRANSLEKWTRC